MASSAAPLTTEHIYYTDTYLFTNTARVLDVNDAEVDGKTQTIVVLDRTVMHPQGGGQPADTGTITSKGSVKFEVNHVRKLKDCNYIEHLGAFPSDQRFVVGDEVVVEIDEAKRRQNARVHSAGHLLDSAFTNLGLTELEPSKGYHFPEGSYVEYIGNIPVDKREEVMAQLNTESAKLIQAASKVMVTTNEQGNREVNVGGTVCMCGGTHVQNTSEIRGLTVTKIKKNKKCIRVSYTVNDIE